MKRISVVLCMILLLVSLVACGKNESTNVIKDDLVVSTEDSSAEDSSAEDSSAEDSSAEDSSAEDSSTEDSSTEEVKTSILKAGDIYETDEFSYHIIGIRTQDDMYLTIKIEILNKTSENINFSTMERILLEDSNGEEIDYAMFGPKEGDVNVTILPGNKVIGEIPFEIEGLEDSYILSIGKFFSDFKPAFEVMKSDIGSTFEEAFKIDGVVSDYNLNDTIESNYLFVTATSAVTSKIVDRDGKIIEGKDNKSFLKVDFKVENNTSEDISFLYSFFIEAFSAKGDSLEVNDYLSKMEIMVAPSDFVEGYVMFESEESITDFYLIITPDITKQNETEVITFTASNEEVITVKR